MHGLVSDADLLREYNVALVLTVPPAGRLFVGSAASVLGSISLHGAESRAWFPNQSCLAMCYKRIDHVS